MSEKLRTFFTNPLTAFALAAVALILFFVASVIPESIFFGQVIRLVGLAALMSALIPCQAWGVWRIRAVYNDIKGVPSRLDETARARLTGHLYIALGLCNVAGAILLRVG